MEVGRSTSGRMQETVNREGQELGLGWAGLCVELTDDSQSIRPLIYFPVTEI